MVTPEINHWRAVFVLGSSTSQELQVHHLKSCGRLGDALMHNLITLLGGVSRRSSPPTPWNRKD